MFKNTVFIFSLKEPCCTSFYLFIYFNVSGSHSRSIPWGSSASRPDAHQPAGDQRQEDSCQQQEEVQGGVWRGKGWQATHAAETRWLPRYLLRQRGWSLQDRCSFKKRKTLLANLQSLSLWCLVAVLCSPGVSIVRSSMRLYAPFYSSDIIIASPLGLRTVLGAEGESKRDFDFLSSIELLVVDQADVFLMQNWEHILVRTQSETLMDQSINFRFILLCRCCAICCPTTTVAFDKTKHELVSSKVGTFSKMQLKLSSVIC